MCSSRVAAVLAAVLVLAPAVARADGVTLECGLVEADVALVDGLLDEWQGVAGRSAAGGSATDAALTARCSYDGEALYLELEVRDERLIRTKKATAGEDHVAVAFGPARLEIWPGHADQQIPAKVTWTGSGGAKVLAVADSLQPKGWAVEVGIPLGRLPGWGRGVPGVGFSAELHDADLLTELKVQEVVALGPGLLAFEEGAALFRQFLSENKLKPEDVYLDQMADLDGEAGLERVVAAGKLLAVLSAEYAYVKLPVARRADVLTVRVVDLAGTGKASLVAHYVERGGGGSREVLAVYNLGTSGGLGRTFAHEVAKQIATARLANTWALTPRAELAEPPPAKGRPKRRPRKPPPRAAVKGTAIVVEVGEVTGFTRETWRDRPAEDMMPILLPWGERQREVWTFSEDEVFGP